MKKIKLQNITHWKGKTTGRKGMGMELALLVLFVVFACSILLVSTAMLGKGNINDRKSQMLERFTLDALAEQALSGAVINHEDYSCSGRSGNKLVITDKAGNPKLTVTWDSSNKITGWDYD